jgi:hypothetical protein
VPVQLTQLAPQYSSSLQGMQLPELQRVPTEQWVSFRHSAQLLPSQYGVLVPVHLAQRLPQCSAVVQATQSPSLVQYSPAGQWESLPHSPQAVPRALQYGLAVLVQVTQPGPQWSLVLHVTQLPVWVQ